MPERVETLRRRVAALREQLENAGDLDPELREQLRSAIAEIEEGLARAGGAGEAPDLSGSLRERFGQALERFEGAHPRLTAALGRVIDALADLGI